MPAGEPLMKLANLSGQVLRLDCERMYLQLRTVVCAFF
jgi:hypothetical protein